MNKHHIYIFLFCFLCIAYLTACSHQTESGNPAADHSESNHSVINNSKPIDSVITGHFSIPEQKKNSSLNFSFLNLEANNDAEKNIIALMGNNIIYYIL